MHEEPFKLARSIIEGTRLKNDGWNADAGELTCPCGTVIELDGKCENGHISPLREYGLV